jgi:hypothetical protein
VIKRTLYQFDLVTGDDVSRDEVALLATVLRDLLPGAEVSCESEKSDLAILRIEIEEAGE